MQFGNLGIGRVFDAAGKPLVVAGGMIVCTVDEMKAAIAAFENQPSPPSTPAQDDLVERVIAIVRHAQRRNVL